jgi:hypothetical protein
MCLGGPLDGQLHVVKGPEYRVALPTEQWVVGELDPYKPVPFRYGIYRPSKLALERDGIDITVTVLAYFGTSTDEARR